MMYKILKLKKGREKSVMNKHPWIFSGALQEKYHYTNGEIVELQTFDNTIAGYGFFSPKSQISCRMFDFADKPVELFDYNYFKKKITNAYYLRKKLINFENTNCFRLIHAEGDFFPGLIIDIYNDTAVIQVLIKGVELIIDFIKQSLIELDIKRICIKNPESNDIENVSIPFSFIYGEETDEITVLENNIQCHVNLRSGQKTGFFLDQRDNRQLVRELAKDKSVLNAFSYTGGFSVYAAKGNAKEVVSVDISKDATEMTTKNILLNSEEKNSFVIKADCFNYLREMPENHFDVIILDPPAFVKSAKNIQAGARGYKEINLQAMKKICKNGLLFTFSCSQHITPDLFQKIVFGAAADSGRNIRIIRHLSQGMDHPINIYHPEGEYLKGLLLYVE
ncbi:MAG TPA: class I SAM-dependent rRNA methyltransferase [Spirochaetia bacterium]|nr:class I SAM-dependent rRNA methyltransferase [Spirochaetia bacterium]HBI38623.1 class I SAM-dependent rRNA methyltransferase [Spirochaetia bacterium]